MGNTNQELAVFLPVIEKAFSDGFQVALGAIEQLEADTSPLVDYLKAGIHEPYAGYCGAR